MLELVSRYDPILRNPTQAFNFSDPQMDPVQLFEDMKATMIHYHGIGLAANQVGIPYSMFVFGDPDNPDSIASAFNPKILTTFGDDVSMEEGCLTFPKIYLNIKRPAGIRVRYTSHNGVTDTIKFEGMTSRIVQHEFDHLNGVLFVSKVNRYHLEKAERKAKKLK